MDNEVVGPHGRLGLAWAMVTLAALLAGPLGLALWLAPTAGLAGVQTARSWRPPAIRSPRRPSAALAGGGAALLPLAAVVGAEATAVAAGVVVAAVVLSRAGNLGRSPKSEGRQQLHAGLTVLIGLWLGAAAAAPVLLRTDGLVVAMVLLALAAAYDTGAYLVGSGAASSGEGPAAGVAAVGAVTLAVAAFLVPPFRGASPWVLGALAAVSAPLGPLAASALLGDRGARVPFLRRLDSLLVMGPLWSAGATLLID